MLKSIYKLYFSHRNVTQHHIRLLRIFIKIAIFAAAFFAILHISLVSQPMVSAICSIAFVVLLLTCIEFNINNNYHRTAAISTFASIIFLITLIYLTNNNNDTLMWTLIFPVYAIALNGRKLGAIYSGFLFAIVYLYMVPQGIYVWEGGNFSTLAYIYYISVYTVLTLSFFFFEHSFETYLNIFNEGHEQLKEAQKISSIGSWEWDVLNDKAKWSDETFHILGLDPQKDTASFMTSRELTHPDDLQMLDDTVNLAIKMKQGYDIVRRLVLPDGTEKVVRGRAKIDFDSNGELVRMVGTMQDITKEKRTKDALREQKEAFETIFNKSNDGVLIIKDGRYIDCNDAAVKMLRASSKSKILQSAPADFFPFYQSNGQDSIQFAEEMMYKAYKDGIACFECMHKRFDGSIFIVDVVLTRIEINNEGLIHASWRDITQRKELEEELKSYQVSLEEKVAEKTKEIIIQKERAEAASKSKSEFLANMNHELRTPMNAILGFIHLLSMDETDAKKRHYFSLVEEGSKSLLNIINDVLDFSKIESGKFKLNLQDVNVAQKAKNFIEFLCGAAKIKDINCHVEIDDSIPKMHMDILRLEQIMSNFISNAIKFTPEHGEIDIRLFFDVNNQELVFRVKDSGIGISKTDQIEIFQPFSQVDMSSTRAYAGTGLGLTITLELIKLHDGKLHLISEVGKGSEFGFNIPYKKALGSTHTSLLSDVAQTQVSTGKSILLAEDNEMNIYLFDELFKKLDIKNVTFAKNGKEALDAYKKQTFDLVLLDIDMPVMNGREAYTSIREYEQQNALKATTIVAVTASSDEENRKSLKALGFDGFLAKPINFANFKKTIEEYF